MADTIDVQRLWRGWRRSPFHGFLEMELESWDSDKGEVRFTVPFKPGYKRTPRDEGHHGGVLASIVDIAGDFALAVKMSRMGFPTIDLRVDYLRPTPDGDLSVVARTVKAGRTIGVADIEIVDGKGRLCVVGRGTYATSER